MAQKTFCDKCKKEIVEKKHRLLLADDKNEMIKNYDLCNNCYQTLVRVLAEYLPQ